MHRFVVQAWINDVAVTAANEQPDTPGPLKRAGPSHDNVNDDEFASFDLGKTLVRPPRTLTRSASSFPTVLASRPVLSAQQQPLSDTSRSSRSRSIFPTNKRLQTAARLRQLAVPIRFVKEPALEAAVPRDARPLVAALSAVAAGEALLSAVLKSHPDFQNDSLIQRHTWCDETTTTRPAGNSSPDDDDDDDAEYAAAVRNHDQLRAIIDLSIELDNMHRVEVITSAQVMPAFCPLLSSGQQVPVPSSETSSADSAGSAGSDGSVSGHSGRGTPTRRIATSVHKMVDYALVLRPSDALQALIDGLLRGEPWGRASINQTRYEPLRAQPAPIFIETKIAAGTRHGASVQLGIWVAAWLECMRNLAAQAGSEERMLTLPVIRVIGGVWSVLYVVDEGTHIRVLHDDRSIGNTTSVLDIYKLQASMAALGRWVDETFTPWFTDLLTRAVENRERA